jgi:hypothetical protein
MVLKTLVDSPKRAFIQLRKKKVGPNKYKNGIKNKHSSGKRSKKKLKNRTSAIKKIEPGNPKKTKQFARLTRKSFGDKKLIPLTSVIKRVLNRLLIASTNKKEFEDNNAWLMSMQKLASIRQDCPLTTQIVSQCISTTVE